ncbi:hypothetical protein N7470_007550 [Penicillium chermesinum]|nr:hypothetical protein N7470_007550 [Penicillium chermesinum]
MPPMRSLHLHKPWWTWIKREHNKLNALRKSWPSQHDPSLISDMGPRTPLSDRLKEDSPHIVSAEKRREVRHEVDFPSKRSVTSLQNNLRTRYGASSAKSRERRATARRHRILADELITTEASELNSPVARTPSTLNCPTDPAPAPTPAPALPGQGSLTTTMRSQGSPVVQTQVHRIPPATQAQAPPSSQGPGHLPVPGWIPWNHYPTPALTLVPPHLTSPSVPSVGGRGAESGCELSNLRDEMSQLRSEVSALREKCERYENDIQWLTNDLGIHATYIRAHHQTFSWIGGGITQQYGALPTQDASSGALPGPTGGNTLLPLASGPAAGS